MIVAGDEGRRRRRWHRGKQRCLHGGLPADGDHHRGWSASLLVERGEGSAGWRGCRARGRGGGAAVSGLPQSAVPLAPTDAARRTGGGDGGCGVGAGADRAGGSGAVRETKDEPSAAPAPPESTLGSGASLGLVEIVLGNGRVLRVAERIDPAVLARLAAALDRR